MLVFGRRLYGRVDHVPVGHVATEFFHVAFVPLVPLASYLVLWEDRHRFTGKPVPLHTRSIACAWLSTVAAMLVGFGAAAAFVFLRAAIDHRGFVAWSASLGHEVRDVHAAWATAAALVAVIAGWLLFVAARALRPANDARRAEIAALLGLPTL